MPPPPSPSSTASTPSRSRPLWLALHRDLAAVTRVRVVADFLAEIVAERVSASSPAG